MTQAEIRQKIGKLQKGIKNPHVADNFKKNMKAKIKELEALLNKDDPQKKKPEKSKATAKKPNKNDAYAALRKEFPELTKASVKRMTAKEYGGIRKQVEAEIRKHGFEDKTTLSDMSDVFLTSKLPKGEDSPQSAVSSTQKKKTAPKTVAKTDKKTTGKATSTNNNIYDWMTKVPGFENLKKVRLKTPFYLMEVPEDGQFVLRGVSIPLKKGETLLMNDEGYPFTFMTTTAIGKRISPYQKMVSQSVHQKALDRVSLLEGRISKLTAAGKKAKSDAKKAAMPPDPKKQQPPVKKEPVKIPEKKEGSKPKKRTVCTRQEGNVLRLTSTFYKWLQKHNWTGPINSKKVMKIVYTKGEKATFLVQTKSYRVLKNRVEWHRICPQSWKMTKLAEKDWPKPNSYRLLLSEREIKKAKTTNGEKVFGTCLTTYRKFYECSKDGSCNADDRQKIKEAWSTCGDLIEKKEKQPEWMSKLWKKVKAEKRKDETIYDAMSRIAKESK